MRKFIALAAMAASLWASPLHAATTVTPLLVHDLPGIPGKEGAMLTVDYAPGGSDPIHRHNASVFVYVLKGSITMQVEGGAPVTLKEGQTFFEGPNDVHLVGRNASQTEPARFLAFFVKDKTAPFVFPVH
ncbi:Cupin 2 conserved barrel domain protein [Gluconacetobacter diazotrophicus PA1 5]|uniref:Cupin domain-containing protein n=1 Tax=Gluconacetobacter diazotrophicus TaxID=33996 RepID=A0A7W4I3X5_GLUDI|nr:cupin domain-containing protein [Gluconacetobacter diazotrophicus]ACI52887.1 Cupin 2 conserved barrel domain protein [Gluconacetobacter diazotrophicus PA1 5]MBB2155374.1 cupin domain-containing protein [Gluconacetobacter diazotrophicus]TWB08968.1 quercetin dioxygenase-like cupin family protein [Gluconacetobacter diazotrophicus]